MTTSGHTLFEVGQRLSLPLYALIDPLGYPDLPDFWRAFQPRAEQLWGTLRFDGAAADWQSIAPLLVNIEEGEPGETLLHWIQQTQPARHQGVLLMQSSLALDEIIQHWQQRISCTWPDNTRALFRCWSPEVLLPWWQTLEQAQRRSFCAGLHSLWLPLLNSDEEACRYQLLWESAAPPPCEPDYHIGLSREQFYLLADDNRLHRLANALWLHASTLWMQPLDIEQVKSRFLSGIALARQRYPRASIEACEGWSAHRWVLGSDFYLHPVFVQLTERYELSESIRIFKSDPVRVDDVRLHYHRPGWMQGELPDITENIA